MFRITLTGAALLSAVPVKAVDNKQNDLGNEPDLSCYKKKRSELPLYTPLHAQIKKPVILEHEKQPRTGLRYQIENVVGLVRKEVQANLGVVEKQKENIMDVVNTAKSHTQSSIDYLNQPHNILPRTGAIAMGGLAGFIFAARGGFIRKVLYTTIGAGGIASLCYPEQASVFARDSLYEARKGYAIAYNFVKGVKPGDEIPLDPINKFPTSVEDLKHMFWDLYDEAKEALAPKKN